MAEIQQKEMRILSPTAILGYGFPEESFKRGMALKPDLIAVDGGSTDPGPYYLGAGVSFTNRFGVKRDLEIMITAGVQAGIPVVIGTAGGAGAKPHLEWCRQIIEEIARENSLSFRMGVIPADIPKEDVIKGIEKGQVSPLPNVPELTPQAVEDSTYIVAQMGVEPIITAHQAGCDVILCGRAYDPAVFAAFPILKGFDPALALHMGKILECAAIASEPGSGSDSVLAYLREDSFKLVTLSDQRRFTIKSTVAHSLYEKSDPYFLYGPGGRLNLTECEFLEDEEGSIVRGTTFEKSHGYFIKLEAARCMGHRTVSVAGTRDPIMIRGIEKIIQEVQSRVDDLLGEKAQSDKIYFHLYGKNGVMGDLEPQKACTGHEMGIVIETVADTQERADTLCSLTRSSLLHYGYEGRISTAGNLAFPFSPSDIKAGPVYEFSIYHLLELDGSSPFQVETYEVVKGEAR